MINRAAVIISLVFLLAVAPFASADNLAPGSIIKHDGERSWLDVAGQPFIVLGVQPDAWVMAKTSDSAARQFAYARKLEANTISVPISWINVEPQKGRYSRDFINWVLEQARKNDLKIIIVWLGSNAVGKTNSPTGLKLVPDYIAADTKIYSRVGSGSSDPKNVLDPADPDTLERESKAFEYMLQFFADNDTEARVILCQILNEVGVYPEQKMRYSEEEFTRHLVAYAGKLTQIEKRVLGVPAYMNFWEGLKGAKPFAFLDAILELDFVGPDLYGKPGGFHAGDIDYKSFQANFLKQMQRFSAGRNLIFVPETNTDAYYHSDRLAYYIAAHPKGIGLSVWAVTHGSHRGFQPLVDPKTGKLTKSGELLRKAYHLIGQEMGEAAANRGKSI